MTLPGVRGCWGWLLRRLRLRYAEPELAEPRVQHKTCRLRGWRRKQRWHESGMGGTGATGGMADLAGAQPKAAICVGTACSIRGKMRRRYGESGDGCSSTCPHRNGLELRPGRAHALRAICGDGLLSGWRPKPAAATTAARASGDGCSDTCKVEPAYVWQRRAVELRQDMRQRPARFGRGLRRRHGKAGDGCNAASSNPATAATTRACRRMLGHQRMRGRWRQQLDPQATCTNTPARSAALQDRLFRRRPNSARTSTNALWAAATPATTRYLRQHAGSFSCTCKPGYAGDGKSCVGRAA